MTPARRSLQSLGRKALPDEVTPTIRKIESGGFEIDLAGMREGVGEDAIVWGDEPYKVQCGSIAVVAPGSPVS